MGHIKYNETDNFQEKKCWNKFLKNTEQSTITTAEYTEEVNVLSESIPNGPDIYIIIIKYNTDVVT